MTLQYPKLKHNEKRSVKMTTDTIEELRKDFPKNPNYKIFAKKYNVHQNTIRRWVDEEYRQKRIETDVNNRKKRIESDPNYRDHLKYLQKMRLPHAANYKKILAYSHHNNLVKNMSESRHTKKLEYSKIYRNTNHTQMEKDRPLRNAVSKRLKRAKDFSGFRLFLKGIENESV